MPQNEMQDTEEKGVSEGRGVSSAVNNFFIARYIPGAVEGAVTNFRIADQVVTHCYDVQYTTTDH